MSVPLLDLAVVPHAEHVVVRLTGEADLSTRDRLAAGLGSAAALRSGTVLVDVAAVRFCDCSGLRVLAAFAADLERAGRDCRLTATPARTRRLLELAGLAGLLDTAGG